MRTTFSIMVACLFAASASALTAPRPVGATIVVVPARYSVLQVAFDVSDRMGAVLVAYQGDSKTQTPVIDYWAGQEWKRLSLDEYAQCAFVQGRVSRFIIVGPDDIVPPVLITSVSSWCQDIQRLTSLDTPGLVNAFGKAFSFSPMEWEWFARRYNLQLADRNAERRQRSWYDRNYYDDDMAHRWQWLRRKYNPPNQAQEPEPVQQAYQAEMEPPAGPERPFPATTAAGESSAAPDPTADVERLDIPLVESASPDNQAGEPAAQETVEAPQGQQETQAPSVGVPEEEAWPVK